MAKPPRTAISGTFFITAVTANRRRLFQTEANANLFLQTLQHYRLQGLYKLHAFVAMPDHTHLLLTTADLPQTMKHIRGGFSHRLALQTRCLAARLHRPPRTNPRRIRKPPHLHPPESSPSPPHHQTRELPLLRRFPPLKLPNFHEAIPESELSRGNTAKPEGPDFSRAVKTRA
jgi:REP element-mobilizing transposase RayT